MTLYTCMCTYVCMYVVIFSKCHFPLVFFYVQNHLKLFCLPVHLLFLSDQISIATLPCIEMEHCHFLLVFKQQLIVFHFSAGSLFLFNRKVVRYFRKDGYRWRKKKDGKTVKEAHEKLKVCCSIYYL
jgi:hypothetical protein